jgi:hypothetical protein
MQNKINKKIATLGIRTLHVLLDENISIWKFSQMEKFSLENFPNFSNWKFSMLHVVHATCGMYHMLPMLVWLPNFQALYFQGCFVYGCGINIGCRTHVFQTVLFKKIYSII